MRATVPADADRALCEVYELLRHLSRQGKDGKLKKVTPRGGCPGGSAEVGRNDDDVCAYCSAPSQEGQ